MGDQAVPITVGQSPPAQCQSADWGLPAQGRQVREGPGQAVPQGSESTCPPDGNLELLLRRHEKATEGLVGLVETHQQDLLHAGHLGRVGGRGRKGNEWHFSLNSATPGPRPPVPWRRPLCGAAPWALRPRGRAASAPRRTAAGTGSLWSTAGSAGHCAGGTRRGPGALTLLRAPNEDDGLERHRGSARLRRFCTEPRLHNRAPAPQPSPAPGPARPRRHFRARGCDTSASRGPCRRPPTARGRCEAPGA